MPEIGTEELSRLLDKLHRERAMDFRGYKPSSLARRVQRRLEATQCQDIETYTKFLDRRSDEYAKLIDSLLINVTEFFRDEDAWDAIRNSVLPQILAEKHAGDQIRIWSAGCATGEEPYSLAIALSDILGARLTDYDVRIYATDIDDSALNIARRGEYNDDAVKGLSQDTLERYFTKNAHWALKRDVRRMVIFGRHNLVADAPISHVDLIACRNVLIYMSVDLQNKVLTKFEYGLQPRGFLFLGKAESLLVTSRIFSPVNERWRIFRKQASMGAPGRALLDQQLIGQAAEASSAEYQMISAFNDGVLRHMPSGVIAVDNQNVVRVVNPAAETIWGVRAADLLGTSMMDANLPPALQEVLPRLTQSRTQRNEVRVEEMDLSAERARPFYITVAIDPILDIRGGIVGMTVVAENITSQVRLRNELEAVNEQLQATNEELETTNEELQSTNEELETTNEELQATNEELETTNEELQSTNEELSTTNDELSVRTSELNALSVYYSSVLDSVDIPVLVLNKDGAVTTFNPAAERFYGIRSTDVLGRSYLDLPLAVKVARARERLRKMRGARRNYRSRPITYTTRTGESRDVIVELCPLADDYGDHEGTVVMVLDAGLDALETAAPL